MKRILIAGNWKSNKTASEAMEWLQKLSAISYQLSAENINIVLCVPFTLLYPLKQEIDRGNLPILLGAQDVSPFPDGAYTGEVNARQVKELCDWVIIGHLERRSYFYESEELLTKKVIQAKNVGLRIIYCVSNDNDTVPEGIDVVAYEPYDAILGSGKSEDPTVSGEIIARMHGNIRLYGGSVTSENIRSYMKQPAINGVLVGGASLDPEKFSNLIRQCSQK